MKGFPETTVQDKSLQRQHILTLTVLLLAFSCHSSGVAADCTDQTQDLEIDTYDKPCRTCAPIAVESCRGLLEGLGYNTTGEYDHVHATVEAEINSFKPLIINGCSKQLKQFLCVAYVPMCDPKVTTLIRPCRPACENVKRRCQPVLQTIGFKWPPALNCSLFHVKNTEKTMCMDFPKEEGGPEDHTESPLTVVARDTTPASIVDHCSMMKSPSAYKYINSTGRCHARCNINNIFNTREKQFAEIWMAVWTSFCFLFSVMTVITFFIDTSKFHYPKRPIIFLSICYALYSVAYLIRLIAGREQVSCDSNQVMTDGLDNTNCAAIFLLLYYFSTAAALWWVVLSLTWLLSAGLKWSHDAIELYSSYFHLVAWGIPAVQSIIIIVLRDVSGEELTGLCFVGSENPNSLLGFVIVPFAVYLLVGICLLVSGYIALFCQEKKETTKCNERIEVLMVRIGIFSLLYTVPATCLLACYFYEYLNMHTWYEKQSSNSPSIVIYILKTFSGLLPGITSGLCVLGCKTLDTWANACSNVCFKKYDNSHKASYQSNNNNNSARHYTPVKGVTERRGNATPSVHSGSRTSSSRAHTKHHHSNHYVKPPCAGRLLQYPGEYHV